MANQEKNYEAIYVCGCGNVTESDLPDQKLICSCGIWVKRKHDCECAGKHATFREISDHYARHFQPIDIWKIELENPLDEAPKGRSLYYYGICPLCDGFMSAGSSCCDYRSTGRKLVEDVVKTIMTFKPFGIKVWEYSAIPLARDVVRSFLPETYKGLCDEEMDIQTVAKAIQEIEFVLFTVKCGDSLQPGEVEEAHKKAQEIMSRFLVPMGAFKN